MEAYFGLPMSSGKISIFQTVALILIILNKFVLHVKIYIIYILYLTFVPLNQDLSFLENSIDLDQRASNESSDQDLHCFPMRLKKTHKHTHTVIHLQEQQHDSTGMLQFDRVEMVGRCCT